MNKKRLIIIVASILVVVAIGLGVGFGIANGLNDTNANEIWYKEDVVEFLGVHVTEVCELVNTSTEFNTTYSTIYESVKDNLYNDSEFYDSEFFKDKSLIVLTINAPSSVYKYSVGKVYIENNVLIVDVNFRKAEGFAAQMIRHWLIYIEVKKSDITDITNIDKRIVVEQIDAEGE